VAQTYDDTLPTNRDWVRRLLGDTDVANTTALSDEEIDAVISDTIAEGAAIKYYAAADCLNFIRAKFGLAGEGKLEKQTVHLRIKWGYEEHSLGAVTKAMKDFRLRGSMLMDPSETRGIFDVVEAVE